MQAWIARLTRELIGSLRFRLVDAYLRYELWRQVKQLLDSTLGGVLHANTRKSAAKEIADSAVDALWARLGIESRGSHPAGH